MFIKYPGKRSTVPIRHFVPNLITTIALCCGLASIHFTLQSDWHGAILAIIFSAIFDGLDGRAARLLKVSSPFGAVLDSLSDFLSFGVAPAVLLYKWMLMGADVFGLAAAVTFALCSALRLARFTANVKPAKGAKATPAYMTDEEKQAAGEEARAAHIGGMFFTGMPTPAAAAAVLIPPMLMYSRTIGEGVQRFFGMSYSLVPEGARPRTSELVQAAKGQIAEPTQLAAWTVIIYTFLIAFLMVSRIPMFSFKKMRVGKQAFVPLLLIAGLIVVLVVHDRWLAMSVLAGGYLLSLLISVMVYRRIMARPVESWIKRG